MTVRQLIRALIDLDAEEPILDLEVYVPSQRRGSHPEADYISQLYGIRREQGDEPRVLLYPQA